MRDCSTSLLYICTSLPGSAQYTVKLERGGKWKLKQGHVLSKETSYKFLPAGNVSSKQFRNSNNLLWNKPHPAPLSLSISIPGPVMFVQQVFYLGHILWAIVLSSRKSITDYSLGHICNYYNIWTRLILLAMGTLIQNCGKLPSSSNSVIRRDDVQLY